MCKYYSRPGISRLVSVKDRIVNTVWSLLHVLNSAKIAIVNMNRHCVIIKFYLYLQGVGCIWPIPVLDTEGTALMK